MPRFLKSPPEDSWRSHPVHMTSGESRPLRIALFHDLPSGGAKRTVHAQVRELTRRAHRVDAYITSTAEESFLPLQDVAHDVHEVELPQPPDRERMLSARPRPTDLLRSLRLYRQLSRVGREVARTVEAGGYDVLLVHPSQFTQAPHVLRYATIPTVYYCHEVLRAAYEPLISSAPVRLVIRASLGRMDRKSTRAATAIATNSRYTRRRVREVYGRDATPAPPGVDLDVFKRSAADHREAYVLAVGALHPLKGVPFLLEALGRIPVSARPPLIVVSDRFRERERERIVSRAAELGVELDLRQRVGESELVRLYSRARAVLAAPHREPLGLVPLEAMACGTPVVAVADGGITETVVDGETGFLVARATARFAERVRFLLDHPPEVERMGQNGRLRVEAEWGWERSVDRLLQLLTATAAAK